jgi:hypothetical protein
MKRYLAIEAVVAQLAAAPLAAEPGVYATPHDALMALVEAVRNGDRDAILKVFGPENEDMVSTGDAAEDRRNALELAKMYRQGYRMEPQADGSVVIALGEDSWPFPVPLAQTEAGWAFDAEAGREEVLNRDIGGNELEVIDLMDAYVDLQAAFRLVDLDGDGVMEFARHIISSGESRDGLFWAGPGSPVGEELARASLDGYSDGDTDHAPEPHQGYYFRILTAQTETAPGGAMEYLVNGNMVAGHALLAVPAAHGETGLHSFMVSENGVILEANLGPDTLEKVADMTAFDPGEGWAPLTE